jgi:hypothetical protein
MSQGNITNTYSGFGKGYIVDTKNYLMNENSEFEIGENVNTEFTPISRTGLRIEKIA